MRLWAAQTISAFGARIARDGLPMTAVVLLKAPPAAMGVLSAVGLAAYGLVGIWAGPLADRLPRRALMIGADFGRTLVILAVPAAVWLHSLNMLGLGLALALMSGLTVVFDVADHAFLPQLVDQTELVDGNAKQGATDATAEVGGPAVAGVLFQLVGAATAVGLSAITYLSSALLLLTIRPRGKTGPLLETEAEPSDASGYRIVLAHPVVRPIWLMAVADAFFGWFIGALYILYALQVLRLTTSELGLTVAAGGVGALAGAALAPWFARRLGGGRAIVVAGLLMGVAAFCIPLAAGPPLVAMALLVAAQLVGDGLRSVRDIGQTSLRQAVLPPDALGRTAGVFATGQGLAGVAGALIGGALGSTIGPRATLYLAAAGVTASALIGLTPALWRARMEMDEST